MRRGLGEADSSASAQPEGTPHGGIIMERPRGVNCIIRRVVGVRCVHYIEEKDCTARFATGAI